MGPLVKAEFRKIFTTGVWWGMLIPVAILSFFASWAGTALGAVQEIQDSVGQPLPLGLLTVSMSTNFCTVFAVLFGALSYSSEHNNKNITTTYLTGNPRGAVMGAKLISYANLGLLYGLVNLVLASLGALLGAGLAGFGNPADWFAVGAAGLLSMMLWTLLGVGLGAIITNPPLVIVTVLVYKFFELVLAPFLATSEWSELAGYLPGAAASGIVGNIAVPVFIRAVAGDNEQNVPAEAFEFLHFTFGGTYGQPWWASVLTFAGYAAVAVVGGWLLSRRRDIT
ncbi:ABC transporter permease [Allosaccharopolyspora coralli]|uniref:ABC transporter permease n=1 Tax=Allosaccharopolyspora coralli TaxID=2665642 RepID=A0A5Q3Q9K2_9PSEU|nr:ABC transporter permease [Allosaccharopolyspora coralli]QGK71238.1 ABC transporter permease [Allosaccharopolyspora coralli]